MHLNTEKTRPPKEPNYSSEEEQAQSSKSKDHHTDFDSQLVDALAGGDLERALELINNNPLPLNLNLVVPSYFSSPVLTHVLAFLPESSPEESDEKKVVNALINKAKDINPNEKTSYEYDEPLYLKLIKLGEIELAYKVLDKSNAPIELQSKSGKVPGKWKDTPEESVSMDPIATLADLAKKGTPGIKTLIRTLLFMSNLTPKQCEEYAKTFPEVKAVQQTKEKITLILDNYAERKGAVFFQRIPLTQRFNWCLDFVKDINLSDKKKCELFLTLTASHQRNCDQNAIATIPGRVVHEYIVHSGIKETANISENHQKIFKNMIAKVVQEKLKELTEQKLGKYRGPFIILVKNKLLAAYEKCGQISKQSVVEKVNEAFNEATWPAFTSKVESILSEHLLKVPGITEKNKGYYKNLLCSVIFREFANGTNGEDREIFLQKLIDDLSFNQAFYEAMSPDFKSRVESMLNERLLNVPEMTEQNKESLKNLLCSFILREFANGNHGENRETFLQKLKDDLSRVTTLDLGRIIIGKHVVGLCKDLPKDSPALSK